MHRCCFGRAVRVAGERAPIVRPDGGGGDELGLLVELAGFVAGVQEGQEGEEGVEGGGGVDREGFGEVRRGGLPQRGGVLGERGLGGKGGEARAGRAGVGNEDVDVRVLGGYF